MNAQQGTFKVLVKPRPFVQGSRSCGEFGLSANDCQRLSGSRGQSLCHRNADLICIINVLRFEQLILPLLDILTFHLLTLFFVLY